MLEVRGSASPNPDREEPVNTCDGCLGSRRCWVCLGTGRLLTAAVSVPCHRCAATGRCSLCRDDDPRGGAHQYEPYRARPERLIILTSER